MRLFSCTLAQRFYASLFLSALAVAVALYFQFGQGIQPCPLCILQRTAMLLIAAFSFIALLTYRKRYGAMVCSICNIIAAIGGLFFALKQVLLQYFPSASDGSCPIMVNQWVNDHPWLSFLHSIFVGTGDCAEYHWHFLGLSMAVYSALLLSVLLLLGLWQIWGVLQQRSVNKS